MKNGIFSLVLPSIVIYIFTLAIASAHNGPIALPPSYTNMSAPVPTQHTFLDYGCTFKPWSFIYRCERSASVELALEREYWGHIQNLNFPAMENTLQRINSYTIRSRTAYNGRLNRLIAFGHVFLSQKTSGITLDKIPNLVTARIFAGLSNIQQPNNVNTLSITGFTDSLIDYAFSNRYGGDSKVQALLNLVPEHGDYGLEAEVVGAMALTYTTDPARIRQGLSILNDCQGYNCTRTTSLAPFKRVGVMLSIAEAQFAVNDTINGNSTLLRAERFATEKNMPALQQQRLAQAIFEIKTKYADQATRLSGIGAYRLPAGPSQNAMACALCHTGAKVPDHVYNWLQ